MRENNLMFSLHYPGRPTSAANTSSCQRSMFGMWLVSSTLMAEFFSNRGSVPGCGGLVFHHEPLLHGKLEWLWLVPLQNLYTNNFVDWRRIVEQNFQFTEYSESTAPAATIQSISEENNDFSNQNKLRKSVVVITVYMVLIQRFLNSKSFCCVPQAPCVCPELVSCWNVTPSQV
jgi:hypothetical protein